MQVHFTPEQEAHLTQIAAETGTNLEHLVQDATMRLLREDLHFREGVKRGIAAADRGEFVESSEVWSRVEAVLQR